MRQIILDTETTGLSAEAGHRIIEIGCLEMINRKLTGNSFHYYINPERVIDRGAEEVHGISQEFLSDKPKFSEIYLDFINFVHGAELIIHNAPFDVGFINAELQLVKYSKNITDHCQVTDSLVIARHKHPGQHNNLDALCKRYQVDNSDRGFHGALKDAELLARVYLMMTGGQAQLFQADEPAFNNPQNKIVTPIKNNNRKPLPIIYPTPEELIAHQEFMDLLKEKI